MKSFQTSSAEETIALGRQLSRELPPKGLVLLIGNLGAGKTTLVKGIAEGLGCAAQEEVTSPTFTLIHEFGEGPGGGAQLYHIDLYRLEEARQVTALGIDELLERDAMVVIEWGERFPELWPAHRAEIRITRQGEDQRRIEVALL